MLQTPGFSHSTVPVQRCGASICVEWLSIVAASVNQAEHHVQRCRLALLQQRGVGEAWGSPGHGFAVLSVYPPHQRAVTPANRQRMEQTCSISHLLTPNAC